MQTWPVDGWVGSSMSEKGHQFCSHIESESGTTGTGSHAGQCAGRDRCPGRQTHHSAPSWAAAQASAWDPWKCPEVWARGSHRTNHLEAFSISGRRINGK